jgi:ferredoxin--NADP+ reductase
MGIPGEDLPGSWAATEFVAWYNGHPDYRDREFDLSHERAVVIGNGNVAADVARMLALTREELACTDIADYAIDPLAASGIKEIVVLGRRGPAQAAFTNPELLELGEMTDADVYVEPRDVKLDAASRAWLESEDAKATPRKNVEILTGYSSREPTGKRRRILLRFLVSPVEIIGDERVEGVRVCRNELREEGGSLRACATDKTEVIEAGIVFRSIGYRGIPLPGLPFEESRGVIPNEGGRIKHSARPSAGGSAEGERMQGEYVVGWIKRGPTGIIGTNKRDAQETVDNLLADLEAGRLLQPSDPDRDSLEELLDERKPGHVTYEGWEAIDRHERVAGEPHGRPRVKLTSFDELLEAARAERVSG